MENAKSINEYESAVLRYNKIAMNYLKYNNLKDSLLLLRKAEDLLNSTASLSIPNRLKLIAITLNNLGCYFKKRKQPKVALHYLEQAMEIESQTEVENINLASSHLNICAVYSSLNNHKRALAHAKLAISLLEAEMNEGDFAYGKSVTLGTSLAIAYYNAGVEQESLSCYTEAMKNYEKALEISKGHMGMGNSMTAMIQETLKRFENRHKKVSKSAMRSIKATISDVEWNRGRLPSVISRVRNSDGSAPHSNRLGTAYITGTLML
jgi:tetratricopeptide (TPR) repeat protein